MKKTFLEIALSMAKAASLTTNGEVHVIQIGADNFIVCQSNPGIKRSVYIASYEAGKLTNAPSGTIPLSDVARDPQSMSAEEIGVIATSLAKICRERSADAWQEAGSHFEVAIECAEEAKGAA